MDYINLDLLGYRCPDVAQKLLKGLAIFAESDHHYAVITTIEPSAARDLAKAIALKYEGRMLLAETQESAITPDIREHILGSDVGFDDDDLSGVTKQLTMLVSKIGIS
ncbi:hypothetical protein ABT56_18980 [Photobacterium aquae]|uniref:Uncharacterized protein n=1 Tax=Photobacterium aquae TaxID=1195763 RepID=A0A0J1GVP7_9GAMM|nr:hypothetical protein [Photobacterium aquae]KLV03519.1 hypothetical protein ABT56_18980 [Photobacterium aquae]